jgi:hypothetical protein
MPTPPQLDVNPASRARVQAAPVFRTEHREGSLTRMVEHQAAKIPSDVFLFFSLCAMAVSLGTELSGRRRISRFVGMWPGPLLIMGVYLKLVKTFGAQ